MKDKVVLGLSDGVDSAVAARLLLDAGYDVCALYLDISGEKAKRDAEGTANALGLSLRVEDIHDRLEAFVCAPFARAYLAGETPNPCIGCNPNVKFPALLSYADAIGAKWIATGHYAVCDTEHIFMGAPDNDQSYMLCRLTRAQISRLLLPLGGYEKPNVRAIAARCGLAVADKPDSRENCFITGMTYAEWIEKRGEVPGPGDAVYRGEVIGRHAGIHRYTVGQRWGETYRDRRLYVSEIRPDKNEIELQLWESLFHNEFDVRAISWQIQPPTEPLRASVRVRHTRWETPMCTVYPAGENGARIVADEPLRAPARGQTAALYSGNMLLGGGTISGAR